MRCANQFGLYELYYELGRAEIQALDESAGESANNRMDANREVYLAAADEMPHRPQDHSQPRQRCSSPCLDLQEIRSCIPLSDKSFKETGDAACVRRAAASCA